MLPEAYVSHCAAHRLRIKIPSQKRSESFFRSLAESVSTLPGIKSVESNPLTGSILICHHSDARSICASIRQQRIVSLKEAVAKRTTLRQDITRGVKSVNTRISSMTGGKADLLDVAGVYLIGAGVYQLLKGNLAAPAWYTAFWYAFGILSKTQSGEDTPGA